MPTSLPSASSSAAVVSAAIDAFLTSRLIGTMPIAGNRNFVCQASMYSALPRNTTGRGAIAMTSGESKNDRWFGLMIAGPSAGTLSRPSTLAR